jgi:hypothetical protein
VIVAGACVSATFDGEPGGAAAGSVIVSRGWIDIDTAYGSTLVAAQGATVGRSHEALFINAEVPAPRNGGLDLRRGSKSVKLQSLPVESMPTHPLASELQLLGVIQTATGDDSLIRRRQQARGVVFRFRDRRYVAELGQPIVDEAGTAVAGLQHWSLAHASDRVAIFRNGDDHVVVRAQVK